MDKSISEESPAILIVDDRIDNVFMLENILAPLNVTLISALSGKEALEKIKNREIALALLDIRMPEMDGIELAEIIHNDQTREKIPIIFITALVKDELEIEKCYESGAIDFILKPFRNNILVSKVKVFLELYRQKKIIYNNHVALEKSADELIQLNQNLKESNDLNNSLLQTIPFGMNIVDEDGNILFQSENFQKLVGKKSIGQNCWNTYSDNHVQCAGCSLSSGIKIGLTETFESKGMLDGRIFQIIHTGMIFQGNRALLGIFQDISDRKRVQEELQVSHEQLKKSQEISHSGSWQIWLDSGIVTWSDEMYKIFGMKKMSPDEDMREAFTKALYPDEREKVEETISAIFSDGIARPMEYRILHSDGSIKWVHSQGEPFYNNQGRLIGLQGYLQDFTDRKNSENAVIESEKMYRTLLNASPEGIMILDLRGRITEISDIVLEIFGAERKDEFIGKHVFQFIPRSELVKVKSILSEMRSEGLVQDVEFIMIKKNQTQFICELSTTLIQEANGKPKAYMAIFRDISQRKKIEQQFIRTERMVSLGEMASAMAHEINQPLLSISLGIDNLFHKIKQAKVVDENYFNVKSEKIFQDVIRIGRIIDHVRAFSRDHDDYILSSFSINESIHNAISMISEQFKHRGIGIILLLDKKVHPIIGNTYRFEQVILNLLTNAKDSLEEANKSSNPDFKKTIVIRTTHDSNANYVEVKDNGNGISPDIIDRIMLPFYTTKEVGKGTGLGLSISFGIIKELNGSIEVESKIQSGTTFRITLPLNEKKEKPFAKTY